MSLADARRILADLIGFPTLSGENNLELVAYAAAQLDALGARTRTTVDPNGTQANLFATFGPDIDGGVILSGHTDVVPAEGTWSHDPFDAWEADGRVYGRGACDMKAFIACALAMAPVFARGPLKRPVHFAFTYDEEVGCFGAQALMKALAEWEVRPAVCIIGEPTGMRIIEGHKGCNEYTTTFTGVAGHASEPERGVNAIAFASRFVARLGEIGEEMKARAPAGSPFTPPWTTLQAGMIAGGAARNIIPEHCAVEWESRPISAADAEYVREAVRRCVDEEIGPEMARLDARAGAQNGGDRRDGRARAGLRFRGGGARQGADRRERDGGRGLRHGGRASSRRPGSRPSSAARASSSRRTGPTSSWPSTSSSAASP